MLIALSICLFIVFAFYPMIDKVKQDRKNIQMRAEAHYLLYEKLTAFLEGSINLDSVEIKRQNHIYILTWRQLKDIPDMVEGCIQFENVFGKSEMVCDATKK